MESSDSYQKKAWQIFSRSSDRYIANNPRLYSNNNVRLGHATDRNIGSTLQLRSQQTHLGTSQYSPTQIYPPVDVSQTFAIPMYPPMKITDNQSYGTGLTQEKVR